MHNKDKFVLSNNAKVKEWTLLDVTPVFADNGAGEVFSVLRHANVVVTAGGCHVRRD
jgi:hypothetical protein